MILIFNKILSIPLERERERERERFCFENFEFREFREHLQSFGFEFYKSLFFYT